MVAWVAVLLGFTMFLRKSNLVPDSMEEFEPKQQFCRSDVLDPLQPMMIDVRWSKTNQYRKKVPKVPVLPTDNKAICPVLWMHYLVNTVRAGPMDAAFTIYVEGVKKTLSSNQLSSRLKKWLNLIREPSEQYSLHSMRCGGATFAYQCNIESHMIKILGDWASDAYQKYIDIDSRYDSMKSFVEGLNKRT